LDKSRIIRGVVAVFLWGLIILCFLTMIRANGMMVRNLKLIESGTVSPEQIAAERMITETARGFVFNWAAYNGDDQEYKNRLKKYGKTDSYKLGSIQKCNSVEPLEITQINKNTYRVKLTANISRLTVVPEVETYSLSSEQIIKKEQTPNGVMATIWKNQQETVEVTIKKDKDNLTILGYPVLVADTSLKYTMAHNIIEPNQPVQGFIIFGKQMLDLYYRGEDLSNYAEGEIKPLGGYTLNKCELIGYEEREGEIVSLFKATISNNAVKDMEQYVFVVAKKSGDKWQLIRVGSY
jgi:hypothetical protein